MTAYHAGDPCCDEAGWLLGSDGTPLEPAEQCKTHPEKRTPPRRPGKQPPDKPVTATRQGNKDKFAWFYTMLADPEVTVAAKVVGAGCVMKMAGHKGHFKATHKAVANLCGISVATVRRGLDNLIDKRYLYVEPGGSAGAANTYYLILPAERWEDWFDAEKEYQREVTRADAQLRKWLYAENKWHEKQAETQFRAEVFDASIARGATPRRAEQISDWLVNEYRAEGRELDIEAGLAAVAHSEDKVFTPAQPAPETTPSEDPDADQKRAAPCSTVSGPLLNVEQPPAQRRAAPCSTVSSPLLTPDTPSSANEQTHKSFKDSERPVKVFQDLESETALRDALARVLRPVRQDDQTCGLCEPDGIFLGPDGFPIVLMPDDDYCEDFTEYAVECQHTMAGNLAEIQRREKEENLALCKTGWPAIDSHYPIFRD